MVRFLYISALAFFIAGCGSSYIYKQPHNINDGITAGTLAEAKIDSLAIADMTEMILSDEYINVHSVLIARYNKLVYEEYFNGEARDKPHFMASVGKSFASAMVGIAIDRGYLKGVNEELLDLFEYSSMNNYDPRKEKITLKHVLTMTTGLECGPRTKKESYCGYQVRFKIDPLKYLLELPLQANPGELYEYNDGTPIFANAAPSIRSGISPKVFQEDYLLNPMGIVYDNEVLGFTSRDMLKFGLLYLNKGVWNGERLISEKWVEESTRVHVTDVNQYVDGYGYFWWISTYDVNGTKRRVFYAAGNGGQMIYCIPSLDMVVVTTGGNINQFSRELMAQPFIILAKHILPAVK